MIIFLLCSLAFAASDAELAKLERTVKVYRDSDPPDSCDELGDISVPRIGVLDKIAHEKMLRRLAAQKGGNAIKLIGIQDGKVVATMFKCK